MSTRAVRESSDQPKIRPARSRVRRISSAESRLVDGSEILSARRIAAGRPSILKRPSHDSREVKRRRLAAALATGLCRD